MDDLPTLSNLDPIRYSMETDRDVQVDNNEVLSIVTSNEHGDAIGVDPSEGLTHRLHVLGSRIANSPNEMIDIASRKSGEGHEDNTQNLGKNDSMRDPGLSERTDISILGNSSRQGEEVRDIGGDSYRLRRQGPRVNAMGQPTHDQKDLDEDNAQRLGIDTGTLSSPVEQGDQVGVHGDSYRLHM
ncbi:hypothetical protein Moror_1967 [Moniliophthora roreri MCA 2997]|uniref:Uncharacterized protein n=1 Tax=Moniliophthora roreri (strain MCA 2997) TaxID=1381753 RepID=V2WL57_MONRO|nr:hypothetical protein Moror_1967 [Moniliophthora roreri MCA 2997]